MKIESLEPTCCSENTYTLGKIHLPPFTRCLSFFFYISFNGIPVSFSCLPPLLLPSPKSIHLLGQQLLQTHLLKQSTSFSSNHQYLWTYYSWFNTNFIFGSILFYHIFYLFCGHTQRWSGTVLLFMCKGMLQTLLKKLCVSGTECRSFAQSMASALWSCKVLPFRIQYKYFNRVSKTNSIFQIQSKLQLISVVDLPPSFPDNIYSIFFLNLEYQSLIFTG